MKKTNTIVAKRLPDKTLVEVLADGSTRPLADKTDWKRIRAMTDEEVTAAAILAMQEATFTLSRSARAFPGTS